MNLNNNNQNNLKKLRLKKTEETQLKISKKTRKAAYVAI